ncbi:acyltransferase [Propionibacteriaceae bacterium Y1685]
MTSSTTVETEKPVKTHRYDIDLLRVFCGASVILGHTGSVFIKATDNDPANGAPVYWAGHLAEAVNPWAVPTFFAVAGWAVLAGAPPRTEATMLRRIWRHFVPLVVWIVFYLLLGKVLGDNKRPLVTLAWKSALDGGVASNHLWYLFSYLPLIAVLGLAVLFLRGQRPWILAAIAGLAAVASTGFDLISEVFDLGDPGFIWGIAGYQVIYAVLGAFLLHRPARKVLLTTSAGLLLLVCAAGVLWYETTIHYPIQNANPITGLICLAMILLCAGIRVPERLKPLVKTIASCSFGAYLVHVAVVRVTTKEWITADLGPVAAPLALVGTFLLAYVVAYALSWGWGKIPGARKILG